MSWLTDFLEDTVDFVTDDLDEYGGSEGAGNLLRSFLGMGLGALVDKSGLADPKIPVVGYQGGIPEYQAVRQRVAMPEDPNRRPGAGGRRYFTDTIFAQKPESTPGPKKVFMAGGKYLGGITDGMADQIPANVGGDEVRLSDGEFVIPADVVSHLGNGNSNAGAAQLHRFMDDIRKERTGNSKQGKEINPNRFLGGLT